MSLTAVGAYLRTLREARHLSRAKLAALAGTHESQIERIEKGDQDTRGSLLVAIVQSVGGNLSQIGRLLLMEAATAEDGRQIAQGWLAELEQRASPPGATSAPDAQVAALRAQVEDLRAHPEALVRLSGYLDLLTEQHHEKQQREKQVTRTSSRPFGRPRRFFRRRRR
jgi:transcriptional regulator with XRE-family HTH domain